MAVKQLDLVRDVIKPTPRQQQFMHEVVRHRYVLYGGAMGGGKALAIDTPILTPDGYRTMGDLAVGDRVYGPDGMPIRVIGCTEVMEGRPCYRVRFDDGTEIVADAEHLWKTFTGQDRVAITRLSPEYRERRRAKRPKRGTGKKPWLAELNAGREWEYKKPPEGALRTTREIAETVTDTHGTNHSIPVAEPLMGWHEDLPIDPYTLGVWLGDGTSSASDITSADPEIIDRIASAGYEIHKLKAKYLYSVNGGFRKTLRETGLINNKHIPKAYLTATVNDRMELLKGLMDTDGTAGEDGRCEFTCVNPVLSSGVWGLALSLGLKATMCEGRAKLNGRDCGPKYRITFTAPFPVFHLKRKADRQKPQVRMTTRSRYIVSCEPCESVPVKCIQVERPDGMYLAGKTLIPTHNSYILRWSLVWLLTRWAAKGKKNVRVGLFCEDYPALKERHLSKVEIEFPEWLGKLKTADHEYKLAPQYGGGTIAFRNLDDPTKYQSSEFAAIAVDELTKNDLNTFNFLRMRLRWPEIEDTRFMAGTNPGGKGHSFCKGFWIDRTFPPEMEHLKDEFVFVQSKAKDNPHLAESYVDVLRSMPEHLRKAYLDGSWDIFSGQVFSEWDSTRHIEDLDAVPPSWTRFRSMDWGFSKPYAVYWHAVDEDGVIHTYRELYGCRDGVPDVGTQETAEEVAEKVKLLEKGEPISYGVADPAIWSHTGTGPSIAEEFSRAGVHFMPADNNRLAGWNQLHKRLRDGTWKISRTCRHLIRTLPVLTYDPFKVEDVNTREEDHGPDAARYGLMTRPWTPSGVTPAVRRDRWNRKPEDEGGGADSWMAT